MRGDLVVDNDIAVSSNILDRQIVFEVAATRSRSEQNKTQDSRSSKAPVSVENIFENLQSIIGSRLSASLETVATVECK